MPLQISPQELLTTSAATALDGTVTPTVALPFVPPRSSTHHGPSIDGDSGMSSESDDIIRTSSATDAGEDVGGDTASRTPTPANAAPAMPAPRTRRIDARARLVGEYSCPTTS